MRHRRGKLRNRVNRSEDPEKGKQSGGGGDPAPAEEPEWLESVLGASKEGVFTADFLSKNGTTVSVRDGGTAVLDCRVYLRHDKTVGEHEICIQFLPAARR